MKTVNFSAIGTGGIFKTIQYCMKRNKRVKLMCVMDINEQVAKNWGNRLGVPYCTSTDELFEKYEMDAVYIATPHFTHKSIMEEAIANGTHIFVEKPITTTLEDAMDIVQKAEKADVKIGVDFQNRYNPVAYNMVRAVQDGLLGKILYGTVAVPWKRTSNYYKQGEWRTKWETAGGGTLITHAIHFIDILVWAFGNPISVMGKYATRKHDIEVEDIGMGLIEFENGAIAQVLSSAVNDPGRSVRVDLFGEKGNILFRGSFPSYSIWQGIRRKNYPLRERSPIIYKNIIDAFVNYILDDTVFFASGRESLKITSVIDGIYKSARSGKAVKINPLIF